MINTRATLLLFLALASPALAQDDTATVETGGPPTTEYAIPLQSARQDAAGGSKSSDSKKHKTPLFGVGVHAPAAGQDEQSTTTAPAPAASSAPQPRAKHHRARVEKRQRQKQRHKARAAVVLPTAVPACAPADGPGTSATIGGLAIAVLLLGAVLGSIARRRRVS